MLPLAWLAHRRLRLAANPIPVPADKATIRTLLLLGGSLSSPRLGPSREADEAGWPAEMSLWEDGLGEVGEEESPMSATWT